jgi:tRNA(fMet)-specific endonuclease VapC
LSLWILDTDHVSLSQHFHPNIIRRSGLIPPESLYTTVITVEEQMQGWLNAIRQASPNPGSSKLVWAYEGLKDAVGYFNVSNVLGFEPEAQEIFVNLRREVRIKFQDLKIASIALSQNGIVVTRNRRDFEKVPGLQIEDWTVP